MSLVVDSSCMVRSPASAPPQRLAAILHLKEFGLCDTVHRAVLAHIS